jgi:polysaccharide biosynthesis protein PslA
VPDIFTAANLDFSQSLNDGITACTQRRAASPNKLSLSGWTTALGFADFGGTIILAWVVFRWYAVPQGYDGGQLRMGVFSFFLAWLLAASTLGLYDRKTVFGSSGTHALRAVTTWALTFGVMLLIEFAFQLIGTVSRVWFLSWAAVGGAWVLGLRIAWSRHMDGQIKQGACLDRTIVLAGSPDRVGGIADAVSRESGGHLGIAYSAELPGTPGGPTIDQIEEIIRNDLIDRVVIADFEAAVPQTRRLLERMERICVDVTVIPSLDGLQGRLMNVDRIGMLPAIDLSLRPLTPVQLALKRAQDLILAGLILVFTAPMFLIISVAIKLDSRGPVFFRQDREGYHNQIFRVWKFRTMFHHARDPRATRQTSRQDPRVTPVGRILRRLSLDELPQIVNVLCGDMSIVGPRPHAPSMTTDGKSMQQILDEYSARYRLKPGITGLAQVSGCRGEIDSQDKLRRRVTLDCHYIDNWSLAFDLWIILRTIGVVLVDSGAY